MDGTVAYGNQLVTELDAIASSVNNIVGAQISSGAVIADTKLATISTAGKVNVSALTPTNAASGAVILDASSKLPAVDGSLLTSLTGANVVTPLGAWDRSTYSFGSTYQASTDILVYATARSTAGAACTLKGYSHSSTPPTSGLVSQYVGGDNSQETNDLRTISFPVKKGEYWKAEISAALTADNLYTIAIGS